MAHQPEPLRVCHIMSADLWAGAEVQVATLASWLARQRDVALSAVLFNEGRLAAELRALGIEVAVIDEGRHTAPALARRAAAFLRHRHVDIVHTHRYKDTIVGAAAARMAGVPDLVRTVHGLGEPLPRRQRLKFSACEALDKAVLWGSAARVIAVSRDLADTLRRTGYRRSTVIAIHNGLEVGRVVPVRHRDDVRRELGIPTRSVVFGTAGRLSPVKSQASLLRAAAMILPKWPGARFVIAGDGPLRTNLLAMAEALGIAHACVFPGSRADVHDVIAAMDVFVLPSLHEGIPMALLEAMALSRPVVATAVGGVPEVVTDRANGLLVPSGDDAALVRACVQLAANPALALELGTRARAVVLQEFSQEANGQAVLETYRSVALERSRRRGRRTWLSVSRDLACGLAVHGWGKTRHALDAAIERRRMARIRRRPRAVAAALRKAGRVLIVCQGNIIRSPFAARLVAQRVGREGGVTVVSAGLAAVPGKPPHPTAVQLATARRVDLSAHAAAAVAPQGVAESDAIFVMDVPQLVLMRRRFPEARAKTFLLTCLAADTPLEIQDPYAGDESAFQACFDHIARAVAPIVHALSDRRHPV